MNEFWQSCVSQLEQDFPPQQISAWIRPLVPLAFDETKAQLRVSAPNRFKLDWVKKNFSQQIEAFASKWFDRPVQVLFELPTSNSDRSKQTVANGMFTKAVASGRDGTNSASMVYQSQTDAQIQAGATKENTINATTQENAGDRTDQETGAAQTLRAFAPPQPVDDKSRLNVELTFDNFVTGKANQLARAAALQVAENPGTSYNPMFLYGGVGLGKTHLIHAIGNYLLEQKPNARIRYIHAEQYVSDVVRAYQQKAFDKFKSYYHSLDLLLIDDIQFFSGKSRTQEEFFYAFEALTAHKSQVIITSDTYPKEMDGIDERLISRFDSGLTVAIEPPELEMRVAILMKKAAAENIPMS